MKCLIVLFAFSFAFPKDVQVNAFGLDFFNQNFSMSDVQYDTVVKIVGRVFFEAVQHFPVG